MDTNIFKKISLNGRVLYAIRCFEHTLLYLKYDVKKWEIVLEHMWGFTNAEYIDNWVYSFNEIVPDNLLEFKSYKQHDFEYLSEDNFVHLYNLYQNIDEKIIHIMELIHCIASSHMYTTIVGHGENSFQYLQQLVSYMLKNNITLPKTDDFECFSIEENKGFGNRFDGKYLSVIL